VAGLGGAASAVVLGQAGVAEAQQRPRGGRAPHPKTPTGALRVLQAGNKRYRKNKLQLRDYSPVGVRRSSGQKPFAAIITCADSRISPELVFDVERGNLFVSRIAGNSIDTGTLGSTEYAVAVLGVKLVMVLGHSDCGAVKAAIEVANKKKSYPASKYGSIGMVVDHVVTPVRSVPPDQRTLERCISVNARSQASKLAGRGPIIAPALASGKLRVVAAVYDLANGKVSVIP
jgi:carbonic anhydrase